MTRHANQNFGTFHIGSLARREVGNHTLGPGFYSLSSLSNVPFVSLIGIQGREKIFSWGEIVEVPVGQQARVRSESFHTGDVFINSGRDFGVVPARITVPVNFPEVANVRSPAFPCDTRRARRAYLSVEVLTGLFTELAIITGRRETGGHDTTSKTGTPGYETEILYPANTQIGLIPLGFRAGVSLTGNEPMALQDFATLNLNVGNAISGEDLAYYILEY